MYVLYMQCTYCTSGTMPAELSASMATSFESRSKWFPSFAPRPADANAFVAGIGFEKRLVGGLLGRAFCEGKNPDGRRRESSQADSSLPPFEATSPVLLAWVPGIPTSSPFALEEFISTLGARIINLIKYWSTTDTSGQRSDEGYGICYLGMLLDFISKSTMLDARARTRANQDAVTQSCGANREEIGWACPFKQEKRRNGGQQVMSDLNVSQNQHHLVAKRVRDHPAAQHRTGVPVRAIDMCRRPFGWAGCWSMLP
ncbi:hypothetical protein QBC42DRAFT_320345 [Cladorrhinum samala]|uniref:Uncharacterized protein n=1 Tax=Cladorrhinum samala TaxID=585594 RepID=A0AAV9H8X4_9PEZI|nr:hypothetical protein QBC42DRAFT_320345 [Cladorrhinum samala]